MDNTTPDYGIKQTLLPSLSLVTSAGTLVCCALPALLVTLGAGATLAGIVGTAPWLIALSKYKILTFGISGASASDRRGRALAVKKRPLPD